MESEADTELETRVNDISYQPPSPDRYDPNIGLVGCGAITEHHLDAYRKSGFTVAAFCDIDEKRAEKCRAEYYPDADVYTDYEELFARDDIEVVDIAVHPKAREEILEAAIRAGKHILSQKPFVVDLDFGDRLVNLADERDVKLAVNQNGRWAPHFGFARNAVAEGLLGDVSSAFFSVNWDHSWIVGTRFDKIRHAILYDFGIHWFDIIACLVNKPAMELFSATSYTETQEAMPPMLGSSIIEFENAQATLSFDGDTRSGTADQFRVTGSNGSLVFETSDLATNVSESTVTIYRGDEAVEVELKGTWYPDGFRGTMGELLCAIEEDREPSNSGRDNLRSLALCFSAIASADDEEPKAPGESRKLPGSVE